MALPATAALWFLMVCAPLCIYTVWTDLAHMKIRNSVVIALLVTYAALGLILLPFETWAWGWMNLVCVFLVGLLANTIGGFSAGDVKFASAAAPFVAWPDISTVLMLLAFMILGTFALHRVLRAIPAIRNLAPEWESWTRRDFPLGVALAPTLMVYLWLAST